MRSGSISIFPSKRWHTVGEVIDGRFTIVAMLWIVRPDHEVIPWKDIYEACLAPKMVEFVPTQTVTAGALSQLHRKRKLV